MIKTYNRSNHQNVNNDDDEDEEYDELAEIHDGIVNGDLKMIQQALEAGANPNEKFTEDIDIQHGDMTPLALAAALNKAPAIKMLLDYKANVNDTFASLKTTALMTSSFHGHSEVVQLLLARKADVNAVDLQGSTALGYAFGGTKSMDVISQLLRAGIDVNSKNILGMNGLLLVAGYSNDALVRMILEAGADANSTNDFLHSALHIVVVGKWSQIRGIIQGQVGNYGLNRQNIGSLMKDWARSHRELVHNQFDDQKLERVGQFMVDIGKKYREYQGVVEDEDDQEAMKRRVEAVWHYRESRSLATNKKTVGKTSAKKTSVMDNLLSCGGRRSKQAKIDEDSAPLDRLDALVQPYPVETQRSIDDVSNKCARILRMIIDAGCHVDKVEKTFGMTALDMAIVFGDLESTVILMSSGGDSFHLLKMFALSDLHDGIINLDKKKIKNTLNDPDMDVNGEFSPFHTADKLDDPQLAEVQSSGRTPVALTAQLADVGALEVIKMLLSKGAEVNRCGSTGSTPIAEAARLGNVKMVEFLIGQGASIETPSPVYKGATPVSIAAANQRHEVVQLLVDKEAKVDKRDTDGRTSLISAADNNDRDMIQILLGANLLSNFSDRSALMYDLAKQYQRPDKDLNAIMNAVTVESKRLRDAEQKATTIPTTRSNQASTNNKFNNNNNKDPFKQAIPPPGVSSSEDDRVSPVKGVVKPKSVAPQSRRPVMDSDSDDSEVEEKVQTKMKSPSGKQPTPLVKKPAITKDESESEESSEEEDQPPVAAKPKFVQQQNLQNKPQQAQQPAVQRGAKKPPESESSEEESEEEESEDDTPLPVKSQPQRAVPTQSQRAVLTQPQQPSKVAQMQPVASQRKMPEESQESEEEESEDEAPPRQQVPPTNVRQQQQQPQQPTQRRVVQQESSEEETSEEEDEDDLPLPTPQRQPVLPSQRIETQFNKMSVNNSARKPAAVAPPPLPKTRPPAEDDQSEDDTESSDAESPPITASKTQPTTRIPVVIKGKAAATPPSAVTKTTTTTTRVVQPGGGQTTQNVSRTVVTRTLVTTNQKAALESDEDDDDDDDETDI